MDKKEISYEERVKIGCYFKDYLKDRRYLLEDYLIKVKNKNNGFEINGIPLFYLGSLDYQYETNTEVLNIIKWIKEIIDELIFKDSSETINNYEMLFIYEQSSYDGLLKGVLTNQYNDIFCDVVDKEDKNIEIDY